MSNINVNFCLLSVGSVIWYKLLPSQLPVNPNKLWCARIEKIHENIRLLYVEMLEPGYSGLHEFVQYSQIVSIERESPLPSDEEGGYDRNKPGDKQR